MTGVQTCALPICFPVTIYPVDEYIKSLHDKTLDTRKLKNTPQLTDTMRIVYVTLLKNKDTIKRFKYEFNSYYWLFEKSIDVKINRHSKEIDNRTITALYNRGLLKPVQFKDDIQKRTTEVIEYECFECKSIIAKGKEYERRVRFENPNDKSRLFNPIQKTICMNCVLEKKY